MAVETIEPVITIRNQAQMNIERLKGISNEQKKPTTEHAQIELKEYEHLTTVLTPPQLIDWQINKLITKKQWEIDN